MTWTWRLEQPDGSALPDLRNGPDNPPHSNQSDAESWLGENWRELADAGVAGVTLCSDGTKVYGPMPLAEQ
ncbi:MAG: hypothetical protein M3Y06_09935 [Actinomycetota bacterium]|nr:hypothetical protein [Actinomycetota bacterium]